MRADARYWLDSKPATPVVGLLGVLGYDAATAACKFAGQMIVVLTLQLGAMRSKVSGSVELRISTAVLRQNEGAFGVVLVAHQLILVILDATFKVIPLNS